MQEFYFRIKVKYAAVQFEGLWSVGVEQICSNSPSMRYFAKNGFCSAAENLTGALGQEQGFVKPILTSTALHL